MKNLIRFTTAIALAVFLSVFFAGGVSTVHAWGSPDPEEALAEAVSAIKSEDFDEAIRLLEVVLGDDGANANALNWMGFSHRKKNNYTQALHYYKLALKADPNHRGANEYIGEAYLELKQPAKAKLHLDRLAKLCGPGCEEYRDLKEAFEAYSARTASARPQG